MSLRDIRVTVVIPTFERARWLGGAIESVLAQTAPGLHLIVSDNASTDGTREAVRRYDDPRLSYVRQDAHLGLNEHFNRWLERVKTDYLVLLPDDDRLAPDFLEATVPVLDATPRAGLVHGAVDIVAADGGLIAARHGMTGLQGDAVETGRQFIRATMSAGYRVHASSALLRTQAFAGLQLEPEDFPLTDLALWLRLALDWDLAYLDRTLATYTVHGDSYSAGAAAVTDGGYVQALERVIRAYEVKLRFVGEHGARLADADELARRARRALRRELVEHAASETLPDRRVVATARALGRCARVAPDSLLEPAAHRLAVGSLLGPRMVSKLKAVAA